MTQDTIRDRLVAARALIDTPEKWTQGISYKSNAAGDPTWSTSSSTVLLRDWSDHRSKRRSRIGRGRLVPGAGHRQLQQRMLRLRRVRDLE